MSDDRGDENNDAQYSEITVGPTDLQASIEGLTNGETYEIRVAGYTKAGVGVVSEAVYARPGDSYSSIYYWPASRASYRLKIGTSSVNELTFVKQCSAVGFEITPSNKRLT